jgi:hypothetical protein
MIAFVTDKKSFSYKIMKTGGTFIIAAILFLSLQAQTPVTGDDGTEPLPPACTRPGKNYWFLLK